MALFRGLAACLIASSVLFPGPAQAAPHQDPSAPESPAAANAAEAAPGVKVPDFATRAWVLADLDSGAILAQRNPRIRLRPASTLKLLTALTVAPRLAPEQPYRADSFDEVADGNRVVLHRGLTYTVADLMHGMLMPSANDAAMALAKANGGAEQTVAQMNAEAARIGATDTRAVNPSGLDADGQFTSARDLAVIGREAFANPEIAAYLKLAVVDFPGKQTKSGKRVIYPIYSINQMLRSGFKGALGGKSGYTTLARRTFVAAAQRDGRRYIVALMDIGGHTYRTAELLLNWGFKNADRLAPIDQLPAPSAPAAVFDRAVHPLAELTPVDGAGDAAGAKFAQPTPAAQPEADPQPESEAGEVAAATASPDSSGGMLSTTLRLFTLLLGLIVLARARVFWLLHRHRTGWHELPKHPSRRRPRDASGRSHRIELVDSR